jgi:hypothetical protein
MAVITALLLAQPIAGARAANGEVAAFYKATWAGLPAGKIRLGFRQSGSDYRNEIWVVSEGLPRWFTRFKADAVAEGRAAAGRILPRRYAVRYDLRKRRNSRVELDYVAAGDGVVAERGAGDTSRKPPLAEAFRRNVVDPLSALAAIRRELKVDRAAGRHFTVAVFDGARRFDIAAEIVASGRPEHLIRLALSLRPIAGFKGETSEDGDPDTTPRPVDVAFTDDDTLMPVSLQVAIYYLPLEVRLDHPCASFATCADDAR